MQTQMHPHAQVATENTHARTCSVETAVNIGGVAYGICSSPAKPGVRILWIGMGLGVGGWERGDQMGRGKE